MSTLLSPQQLQQRRIQAIALFEQNLSNAEIARRIGISRPTVSQWHQRYARQGAEGLTLRPRGHPARLSLDQLHQLAEARLKGPLAWGYSTPLWTLPRVADLIARLTGITYHP